MHYETLQKPQRENALWRTLYMGAWNVTRQYLRVQQQQRKWLLSMSGSRAPNRPAQVLRHVPGGQT